MKDIVWFVPAGTEMTDEDWNTGFVRSLAVRLAGDAIDELDERGERIIGDTLLLLLNGHDGSLPFTLPAHQSGEHWEVMLSTANESGEPRQAAGGESLGVDARSMLVLRLVQEPRQAA